MFSESIIAYLQVNLCHLRRETKQNNSKLNSMNISLWMLDQYSILFKRFVFMWSYKTTCDQKSIFVQMFNVILGCQSVSECYFQINVFGYLFLSQPILRYVSKNIDLLKYYHYLHHNQLVEMSDYQYEEDYYQNYYEDPVPTLLQQNSTEPISQAKVEEIEGVHLKLQKALQEVNQLVALGEDWSLILLSYYKWNPDKLEAHYFNNMDKILKEIHYSDKKFEVQLIEKVCGICLMKSKIFLNNYCGHSFCLDCWKENVSFNISNKVVFIKCMNENCQCLLLNSAVKTLIENSPSNKQKYVKYLCQKYVQTNNKIKFCPGADCKYCIYSDNPYLKEVQCDCGEKFCFRCRSQVHRPCSCDDVLRWKDIIMKEQANAKWLTLNTKICPFCKNHVERSMGCNYMSCAPPGGCGKAFCYVCSKPWEPDHKDHFKCNVYKPSNKEIEQKEKNKSILARINFYCQKYLSNQHSKNKILQIGQRMIDYQVQLFHALGIQMNESQFILGAYKFASEACDALKWSYAYLFLMQQKYANVKKDVFQFQQGQFQKWKQNLTIKLEQKFNKLVEGIIDAKKQNIPIDIAKRKEEFEEVKIDIMSYYKVAKKQMENLVSMVQD